MGKENSMNRYERNKGTRILALLLLFGAMIWSVIETNWFMLIFIGSLYLSTYADLDDKYQLDGENHE